MTSASANGTWWSALYDDWLADQLLERGEDEVKQTIDFLVAHLDLHAGDRVLDQCCGIGSLSVPLALRRMRVVGVDQAAAYVDRGNKQARSRGLSDDQVELVAADATSWVPRAPVTAAFNWWTSFGYSSDDATNIKMLARAFDALSPGGLFALDTMNVPQVLRGFQRDVAVRRQTPRGEVLLLRESTIDLARATMHKRWTYLVLDRVVAAHTSEVKLYMPDAIARMLTDVGFVMVDMLGGVTGEPLTLDSPRLIALARRPR